MFAILQRKKRGLIFKDFAAFVIIDVAELLPGHVRILLIQDKDTGREFWKLPGGKRSGEEPRHRAAEHEIQEELGLALKIHPEDMLSCDPMEGASPHDFVVFMHRVPELRLEQLRLGNGIARVALFDERELVGLLLANRVLPKYVDPLQRYLVNRRVLLR